MSLLIYIVVISRKISFMVKLILFLLATYTTFGHLTQESSQPSAYQKWKGKYGKIYEDEAEDRYRQFIYTRRVSSIQSHNSNPTHQYKLSENQFSAQTDQELEKLYLVASAPKRSHHISSQHAEKNSQNDDSDDVQIEKKDSEENDLQLSPSNQNDKQVKLSWCFPFCQQSFTVPKAVNWTAQGKVSPIKNQGTCGSCWAFSGLGAIQSQYLIKTNFLLDFSQQQQIDCAVNDDGCNGGWMTSVFYYAIVAGLQTEKNYPYRDAPSGYCKIRGGSYKISTYRSFITCQNIVNVLVSDGPVSASVYAKQWFHYHSGIFSCTYVPSLTSVDHAILITGITAEGNFIVKNSWGVHWGEEGYIVLDKNKNCNICNQENYLPLL